LKRSSLKVTAVGIVSLGLLAAACGDDDSTTTTTTAAGATTTVAGATTTAAGATTTAAAGPSGGTLTIGAEQEPDCMDWIGSCGGSSWGFWMGNTTTMPRAYDVAWDGKAAKVVPSAVLAGEATIVTSPKQVVTYKINPKAVWSTGDPITSEDFKYTWDQIANGKEIYDKTGYEKVESVDASKPDTVVVTFKESYPDWKGLFSGGYGILPSKILAGKDRNAEMKDGYSWSAGPWKIDKWEKGVSITLVPNDKFFGDKPKLDKVVFKFVADTASQFQAFKAGELQVIYPQPQLDVIDAIAAGVPGTKSAVNAVNGNLEALWINNSKPPFDSKAVRQAFAYSLDRDAIVKRLFGGIGVDKAVHSLEPALTAQYTDTEAFAGYKKDLAKVETLMKGDGWTKGSDGIWEKGGTKANVELKSTAGNKRRELTAQVVQAQAKEAGFAVTFNPQKSGDLFGKQGPAGDFQVALYAQVATFPQPGVCTLLCKKNIPTEANELTGNNWMRVDLGAADAKALATETEVDEAKRAALGKEVMKAAADLMVSLPLDPLPNILMWSDKVVGLSDNPVAGPFASLNKVTVSK
jgi:peptide/nickel transport system substrate-binding protein